MPQTGLVRISDSPVGHVAGPLWSACQGSTQDAGLLGKGKSVSGRLMRHTALGRRGRGKMLSSDIRKQYGVDTLTGPSETLVYLALERTSTWRPASEAVRKVVIISR